MTRRIDERLRRAVGEETARRIKRFSKWLTNVEFVLFIGLVYLAATHHRGLAVAWACAMGGGGGLVSSLCLDHVLGKPYDLWDAVRSMLLNTVLLGAVTALLVYAT